MARLAWSFLHPPWVRDRSRALDKRNKRRSDPRFPEMCLPYNVYSADYVSSEHLRSVPDTLESLISEKRLLQAAGLLVRSIKLINKQEMLEIGALSDLRSYLTSQEAVGF